MIHKTMYRNKRINTAARMTCFPLKVSKLNGPPKNFPKAIIAPRVGIFGFGIGKGGQSGKTT